MIAIDTDVLAIYFIYIWDKRYSIAKRIIEDLIKNKATTIINVLELSGLMALAQDGGKAKDIFRLIHERLDFNILYWKHWPTLQQYISKTMDYISRGLSLGDAQISWICEENNVSLFLTWNKRHFEGKVKFEVLTPDEYIDQFG